MIPAKNCEMKNDGTVPATAFCNAKIAQLQKWPRKKLNATNNRSPRIKNFVLPFMLLPVMFLLFMAIPPKLCVLGGL